MTTHDIQPNEEYEKYCDALYDKEQIVEWEKDFAETLISLIKKECPTNSKNIQEWEELWHKIVGYSITHLAYMQRNYGKDLKYCIKETKDSFNACYENYFKEDKPCLKFLKEQ